MTAINHIHWGKPDYWGNEERYVLEAVRSSWISHGPFVDRLEAQFAQYCAIENAVATSNGTTALHLAYIALGIQPGDEIIVPGFAFMAAANVALRVHAVPVFADVDRRTWCLDASDVERRISPRTRAIVPVHTYGNVCDMNSIGHLAAQRGIPVLEDAAESFGSSYCGAMSGTLGALGCFSLHATKTVTSGEGGMVVTASAETAESMRLYRSHGVKRTRYWHDVAGHNFRLTNVQAALGCAQIEQIDRIRRERKRMYAAYLRHLEDAPGVRLQEITAGVDPLPWVVAVELDPQAFPQGRDAVIEQLKAVHIETRPGFYTPTQLRHLYSAHDIGASDEISRSVLALPSFATLTNEEIEYVCGQLWKLRR